MRNATPQQPDELQVLGELNEAYIRSVATSDARWFDEHLDEDFLNSNADGSLSERAAFIAQIARPSIMPDLKSEDVRIRILGEVAIIHARTAYTKANGEPGSGRYTDVYARRNGRWLCVSAHVTRE